MKRNTTTTTILTIIVLLLSPLFISNATCFTPSTKRSRLNRPPKIDKHVKETIGKLQYVNDDKEDDSSCDNPSIILEQITKERPYGLFLAEKFAEFVEGSGSTTIANNKNNSSNNKKTKNKERVVVLGSGWGATSFLKTINTDLYDVTVVSPRNYFLFTPMLASATVGSVEYRSITEPIREVNPKVSYLEAQAGCIDTQNQSVTILPVECEGNVCGGIQEQDEITYDHLIYAIGAQTNTFGIPGVTKYCNFLKQINDSRKIRSALINSFERANFPHLSDVERKKYLTFVVIGGGPTGIEFASELRDFIQQDGPKYYPHLLKDVRIKVVEASNTILAPFHKKLQEEAIHKMTQTAVTSTKQLSPDIQQLLPPDFKFTQLLLDSSVMEVKEDTIILNDGTNIDYGLAVWAAGNAPLPLTLDLINDELGQSQNNHQHIARGRIAVDPWLRVISDNHESKGTDDNDDTIMTTTATTSSNGSNRGTIFALGDASCVVHNQLPATGQVAAQQGEYIARLLNKQYDFGKVNGHNGTLCPPARKKRRSMSSDDKEELKELNSDVSISDSIASLSTKTTDYAKPFQFLNLGILAYTGDDTALAQVPVLGEGPTKTPIMATGKLGNELWKSVYLWKQVSWRNRLLVASDWMKRKVFGRDISHFD